MSVVVSGVRVEMTHDQQVGDRAGMVRRLGRRVVAVPVPVSVLERDVQRHATGHGNRQQPGRRERENEEAPGGHEAGILPAARRKVNRPRYVDRERILVLRCARRNVQRSRR